MEESVYYKILREICAEEGIILSTLSAGWLHKLQKAETIRYIVGHKFGLNPQSSSLIADDKFATFEALRDANLPIIEHQLLYAFGNHATYAENRNSLNYVKDYLATHHRIVLKPNNGTLGRDVFYIDHPDEIPPAVQQIFSRTESASMCPFYEIAQSHRFVILDQEVRLTFTRRAGDSSRYDLNEPRLSRLTKIALETTRTLGLRFCSVDFIEMPDGETRIIEVNSGVMLRHYVSKRPERYPLVKEIYRDAVLKMFNPSL